MDFYPLNRTPEQIDQESRLRPGLCKDIVKATGLLTVSLVLFSSFSVQDERISNFRSTNTECLEPDDEAVIVSANVRYNYRFASDLMEETGADIGVFQETRKNNIQELVDDIGCSEAAFAPSDFAVDWGNGGLGNTTVSVGQESTETMRKITGSLDIDAFLGGLFSLDKEDISSAYKENRSALISKFKIYIEGEEVGLNVINAHIGGGKLGQEQLQEVLDFSKKEMNSERSINLIIGDLNKDYQKLVNILEESDASWIVKKIGPTSRDSGEQIDHVIYRPFVKVGDIVYLVLIESEALDKKGSDHKAIKTTIRLMPISTSVVDKIVKLGI